MSKLSVKHDTFVIEKNYAATPAQVFAACSDSEAKAQWFQKAVHFDFRIGGTERTQGGPPGGPVYTFEACYQEIVLNQRIVYSYFMDLNDTRISVSVTTMEFIPDGNGTRLIYTEQGAFLDGHDTSAQREHGTNDLLNSLGKYLTEK